ncbi:YciI family protein [Rhizorhabdus wittichii]
MSCIIRSTSPIDPAARRTGRPSSSSIAPISRRANRILAAGATFAHDGKTVQGGNYIVDMSRAEVDEFVANDPFTLAGIRQSVIIQPWIKACFDRAFLIAVAPPGEPDVNEPLLSD